MDSNLDVQGARHFAPIGNVFGLQGSVDTVFGFTGEQTDGSELLFLRARYYAPQLGVFASLDPFEGVSQRPMRLNGYSWVEGNPINLKDASGLFSCSGDDAAVSGACDELEMALVRSRQNGLTFGHITTNTVDSNGVLDLKSFVRRSEQIFGLQFKAPGEIFGNNVLDLIDLDDCNFQLIGNNLSVARVSTSNSVLVKTDVLRTVAAMIHITSKFGERNFSNPISLFRKALIGNYIEILASENLETVGGGGPVPRGQGKVVLGVGRNDIRIGTGATVATIVHELGHAFDRAFGLIPSGILASGYRYSRSENRFVSPNAANVPFDALNMIPNVIVGDADGMKTRGSGLADIATAGEVWADVFMTWVMDGINSPTTAINPTPPEWDCDTNNDSSLANMWNFFTSSLMFTLLSQGGLAGSEETFLRSVANVVAISPQNPCR